MYYLNIIQQSETYTPLTTGSGSLNPTRRFRDFDARNYDSGYSVWSHNFEDSFQELMILEEVNLEPVDPSDHLIYSAN